MTSATLTGGLLIALPLAALAWLALWRRHRPVFWFAVALILVATGYLMATGAAGEIAVRLLPLRSALPPASRG